MNYKIILVTPDFPPEYGGIQNVTYNLAKNLQIDVIAPNNNEAREFDRKQNFKIYRTPVSNKKMALFFMVTKIILLKPDFLICGHILTAIVGVLTFKPFILYTYGMEITTFKHKLLMKWLIKKAYKVITISEFTQRYLLELGISCQNIVKIYPTVDMKNFNLNIDTASALNKYNLHNKSIMLTVGRMAKNERYKGHSTIIGILPEIIKKIPDLIWIVVGSGDDYERFRKNINKFNLSKYVIFTGNVEQKELSALYKAADVFVMPSLEKHYRKGVKEEGFGIVYVEANACGTPVVAYRTGGVVDAVIDGVTGILVEQGNIEKLTESIIKLLLDKDLSQKLGIQGYQRVSKELNTDLLKEKFEKILVGRHKF